ncbi:GNAT domain-containing protein [Infundibulicybe gibba]|nr:GNAT domain-containing protein [Infundibulicybe gibba]
MATGDTNHCYPLKLNPHTGEPYLALDGKFANIIITPPRLSDARPSTAIMNDPSVYPWMGFGGPQHPYLEERAETWVRGVKSKCEHALRELQAAGDAAIVDGCPVRHIREVGDDGSEVFIGDIGIIRASWTEVESSERLALIRENASREKGDPAVIWQVGYYLAPSHHGRGIMTAALEAIIEKWAVPRMNARHIRATTFVGNEGSLRVLTKAGFRVTDTVQDIEVQGEKRSLYILERRFPEGQTSPIVDNN